MIPRITADDVGSYYIDEAGNLWRLVSYADKPTAVLERVDNDGTEIPRPQRRGGVVGAPIFEGFRKLVPEEPT